jgi:hypothetical protein
LALLKRKPISVMILDALTTSGIYVSHSNYDETVGIIKVLRDVHGIVPDKVLFTGMGCSFDYSKVNQRLRGEFPDHPQVECSYDGMSFYLL